ncbi:MAG: ester cyclase [Verrucomicrobiota bacterium]
MLHAMGSEQNKAVVKAFIQAVNQRDWGRLDELLAPDFARHTSTSGQPQIRSRDQLLAFLAGEAVTFPDAHETIHFLVAEGDMVAVHSGFRGTQRGPMGPFPASGRTLTADLISIYRVAKGRIAEAWVEWDCLSGLIQLGHHAPPSDSLDREQPRMDRMHTDKMKGETRIDANNERGRGTQKIFEPLICADGKSIE